MSRQDEYEIRNETYGTEDEFTYGVCSECGEECCGHLVDCGIGPYEFWGQRCTHHDWRMMSQCCDAPFLEEGEDEHQ